MSAITNDPSCSESTFPLKFGNFNYTTDYSAFYGSASAYGKVSVVTSESVTEVAEKIISGNPLEYELLLIRSKQYSKQYTNTDSNNWT